MKKSKIIGSILGLLIILVVFSCTDIPIPEAEKYTAVLDGETVVVNRCYFQDRVGYGDFLFTKGYNTISYRNGKHDETIFVKNSDRSITGEILLENDSIVILKKKKS
jgi:hypothetical protein